MENMKKYFVQNNTHKHLIKTFSVSRERGWGADRERARESERENGCFVKGNWMHFALTLFTFLPQRHQREWRDDHGMHLPL